MVVPVVEPCGSFPTDQVKIQFCMSQPGLVGYDVVLLIVSSLVWNILLHAWSNLGVWEYYASCFCLDVIMCCVYCVVVSMLFILYYSCCFLYDVSVYVDDPAWSVSNLPCDWSFSCCLYMVLLISYCDELSYILLIWLHCCLIYNLTHFPNISCTCKQVHHYLNGSISLKPYFLFVIQCFIQPLPPSNPLKFCFDLTGLLLYLLPLETSSWPLSMLEVWPVSEWPSYPSNIHQICGPRGGNVPPNTQASSSSQDTLSFDEPHAQQVGGIVWE